MMRWSRLVLLLLLVFDVWYRAHTFGPQVRDSLGVSLWPTTIGSSEPLDCDEAAYAYMGHRISRGDVLYRDLTENKTPLGYWLYALAVVAGGYNELAIRVMAIPFVLLTIILVWWIAGRLGGQFSGCLAAVLYIFLSTDPYLFGNGSNLEHFVNLFSVASLAFLIHAWDRPGRWPLLAAGICLGAAALVKQFAIFPVVIVGPCILFRGGQGGVSRRQRMRRVLADAMVFGLGALSIAAVAAAILAAQARCADAIDDIFFYGRCRDRYFARTERAAGCHSLDHRKCRSARPSTLAIRSHGLPRLVGNNELAALAGLDSIAFVSAARAGNERRPQTFGRLGDRSLGSGGPPGPLLAALLSAADRRCRHRRLGLPCRRRLVRGWRLGPESGKNWRRIGLALLSIPLLASRRSASPPISRFRATC